MNPYRLHLEATIVEAAILHCDDAPLLSAVMGRYIADDYFRAVLEAAAAVGPSVAERGWGAYAEVHDELVRIGAHEAGDGPRLFDLGRSKMRLPTERLDEYCLDLIDRCEREEVVHALVRARVSVAKDDVTAVARRLIDDLSKLGLVV